MQHFRFDAGVAYAYAQAPICVAAELGMYVAQSVVPGVAAAEFHLGFARHYIEFVMHHQNFFWLNFEKFGQCSHGFARQVHERDRL